MKSKSGKPIKSKLKGAALSAPGKRSKSVALLNDIREMILVVRQSVATTVNTALLRLYWQIGQRIRNDILQEKRAEYGREILSTLSKELSNEFGQGFSAPNLSRMMALAEAFPDWKIFATLSQELGWSHFVEFLPLSKPMQRDFYAEMCRVEWWSVRTLRDKIRTMLFERTALSKKPEKLIAAELKRLREEDRLTPDLVLCREE